MSYLTAGMTKMDTANKIGKVSMRGRFHQGMERDRDGVVPLVTCIFNLCERAPCSIGQ